MNPLHFGSDVVDT